jgi:hypothetical protein
MVKKGPLPLFLLVLFSACSTADLKITRTGKSMVDSMALTLDGSRWGMAINGKSFQQDAVLSVMMQESPDNPTEPTALYIMDFKIEYP